MSWERKCFRSVCREHFKNSLKTKTKNNFLKVLLILLWLSKTEKNNFVFHSGLINKQSFLADTFETPWINNWLEHRLSVGYPANNSCYNLPTTTHPCVSKNTNKLEVMKGRQTKSALIAAKSAIFQWKNKNKKMSTYNPSAHTDEHLTKSCCANLLEIIGRDARSQLYTCRTVIEDVTPHSTLPSCLQVVWPDCHSGNNLMIGLRLKVEIP